MAEQRELPPGQRARDDFPRFGLTPYAKRFPTETARIGLRVGGAVATEITVSGDDLAGLPRVEQVSDFHCVTTWSRRGLRWSGFRFATLFETLVVPRARPEAGVTTVRMRCQDGFDVSLPLADMMADDVLLADRLDGAPLGVAHGAPLRLVAPAHYGYKSAKHLRAIELWQGVAPKHSAGFAFMDHPRARVAFEERGRGVPGRLLRYLYRPLIGTTVRTFARALERHRSGGGE